MYFNTLFPVLFFAGGCLPVCSGERLHGMQEVSGSIPLFSTKKALYFVGSMVLFFLLSWRSHWKSAKCLILQAYGRQPPILAVSLFLKMLVRCPTVLQADVSLPLNVRSEIEVKRDVDLIATINVYPADQLVDNHLLRFKVGTVVQVSIGNQLIIQVPVVMRFFSSFSISSNCAIYALCCLRIFVVSTFT